GNDDTVIVDGALTITGENSINVGGGGGDMVIYRGDTGSVDAWRVNAEKLVKDGGGTTILGSEGATFLGGVTVADGTLVFGTDRAADEIVGDATIGARGVYRLGGTHLGAVSIAEGGILLGTGRIGDGRFAEHTLMNAGIVAPGTAAGALGTLTVLSDYTQTATGRLDIELGAPGLSDVLEVRGVANLAGTVNFIPLDLADTSAYTFLTYGSHTGQFDRIGGGGLFFSYSVDYLADRAVVNVVKSTPTPTQTPTGCTPGDPAPGTTVVCKPPISGQYVFTPDDLTVSVEGLLETAVDGAMIGTRGGNAVVKILAGAGIVNSRENSGALDVSGANLRVLNDGVLDAAGGADAAPVVVLAPAEGTRAYLRNADGARIGHDGGSTPATAIFADMVVGATPGEIAIENDGAIYGDLDFSRAARALVDNGFVIDSATQTAGRRLIDGNIKTGAGNDELRNNGTITGAIDAGAGDDVILNYPDAVIGGTVRLGDGDDIYSQEAGRLGGALDMGDGDDLVEFGGSIGGSVTLGAGDDALGIYGAADLAAGATIDGGAGVDTLVFAGNTGTWDASRFAGIETLGKQGGGTSVITGNWALGPDAVTSVVDSGILELAANAELSTAVEVAARGTFLVNGLVRDSVTITEAGGIVGGSGAIGTAIDFAGGRKANLVNGGIVAPGGLRVGSEFG
ncbi:MAG TPA: hypothetical protein VEZ59_12885, partial [Sphingopyxis sp.]|nr:hypothetical protein [Sphingopyxis sp.]